MFSGLMFISKIFHYIELFQLRSVYSFFIGILFYISLNLYFMCVYRVSQEEWTKLRESVPYVELYRYNPKHLSPKLNGYEDNGHRSLKF